MSPMSPAEPDAWQRVSPLAVLFYVGQILRGVARNLFQAVVPATVFLVSTGWTTEDRLYPLAAALLIVLVLVSVGRWLRFRFRVDDDGIRIRQGIFQREELDIGYDRIQGINTTQNPIYRAFGLVDLKLDTAGSATAEGHLPAIPAGLGNSLRGRIRRRREDAAPQGGDETTAATESGETLLQLSGGDMVRIGLSSNRALLLLAVLAPLADQLDERVGEWLQRTLAPVAESLQGLSALATVAVALASILAAAALLMGLSVAGAFLRHYGYTLTSDGEVLRSRGGLLTTHEHSMGLGKLQILRIRQGPLLRLFGVFLYDVLIANVVVARLILAGPNGLRPAFVNVPLELRSELAISLLANIICLTPGTVSARLSADQRNLVVHTLDTDDPVQLVADIKSRYERPLREIFEC